MIGVGVNVRYGERVKGKLVPRFFKAQDKRFCKVYQTIVSRLVAAAPDTPLSEILEV